MAKPRVGDGGTTTVTDSTISDNSVFTVAHAVRNTYSDANSRSNSYSFTSADIAAAPSDRAQAVGQRTEVEG